VENIKKYVAYISDHLITTGLKLLNKAKYRDPVICKAITSDERMFIDCNKFSVAAALDDDVCHIIRKRLGEHILLVKGLPHLDSSPHQAVLIPSISMMQTLGFKNYMKFINEWKGNSKVGEKEVIRYSVLL
jgi:hypothetical protein